MKKSIYIACILCGSAFFPGYGAQTPDPPNHGQDFLETFLREHLPEESDTETQWLLLEYLQENPIGLNDSSYEDWERIPWITPREIQSILDYRHQFGKMVSLSELFYIEGLDPSRAESLIPFIFIEPEPLHQNKQKTQNLFPSHQLSLQARLLSGKTIEYREGSRLYQSFKYRFRLRERLSLGITGEKDSGESFLQKSNPAGYDFYSFHAALQTKGLIKNLILGDYRASFGQGLVAGQGFSPGKSLQFLQNGHYNPGIVPSHSLSETGFFRGIATTFCWEKFRLALFYSRKKTDARLNLPEGTGSHAWVTSLVQSGLHRTPSEIKNEKNLAETSGGLHFSFHSKQLQAGFTGFGQRLSLPILPVESLHNVHAFRGRDVLNLAIDYRFRRNNLLLFGEFATGSGGKAWLQGLHIQAGSDTNLFLLFREYSPEYYAPRSGAFGENSLPQNEKGSFFGISKNISSRIGLSAGIDYFIFPWPRYRAALPSSGCESFLRIEYTPAPSLKIFLQYKSKTKKENDPEAFPLHRLTRVTTHKIQGQFHWNFHRQWTWKISAFYNRYTRKNFHPEGLMVIQDLSFSNSPGWGIDIRAAWFRIEDYYARIYCYEKDLLQTFSVPSFTGRGFRAYVLLRGRIKILEIRCKASLTCFTDRNSPPEDVPDNPENLQTEFRIQLLCKI